VAGRDLSAAVQVGRACRMLPVSRYQAAVVEHLDQVQRAGPLSKQGDRLVVLHQGQVVAAAALEQQGPLRVQDRPLGLGDVLLGLVQQAEPGVHLAALGFGPGQADQQPAVQFGQAGVAVAGGLAGQPQPGAERADRAGRAAVVAGRQPGRVQPGNPVRQGLRAVLGGGLRGGHVRGSQRVKAGVTTRGAVPPGGGWTSSWAIPRGTRSKTNRPASSAVAVRDGAGSCSRSSTWSAAAGASQPSMRTWPSGRATIEISTVRLPASKVIEWVRSLVRAPDPAVSCSLSLATSASTDSSAIANETCSSSPGGGGSSRLSRTASRFRIA
jgi:hypothetical protein